jgi:hypothetical protein
VKCGAERRNKTDFRCDLMVALDAAPDGALDRMEYPVPSGSMSDQWKIGVSAVTTPARVRSASYVASEG